jgi:hypothetical protein
VVEVLISLQEPDGLMAQAEAVLGLERLPVQQVLW